MIIDTSKFWTSAFTNWKTTSAGLIMIIGSTVHLIFSIRSGSGDEATWTVALTAIVGGIGLIFAGDSGASVQTASVKVEDGTGILKTTTPQPTKQP